MIVSYRERQDRAFCQRRAGQGVLRFRRQAEKRLDRLEAATSLQDLAALPGNALEPLRGDRKGQYSIRINDERTGRSTSRSPTITEEANIWRAGRSILASTWPMS
jgi:proteic killer suppression protein